jgi:hypothetical protein
MIKPSRRAPKSGRATPRTSKPASESSPDAGLITATIEAATGRIVAVGSLDGSGEPIALTRDRRARLSKQSGAATLEDLFEQAFEAGIASVLGDDAGGVEANESAEDMALRRQILRPMIMNSAARRLMRREVLGRAMVGTLILKSARSEVAPSRPSAAT